MNQSSAARDRANDASQPSGKDAAADRIEPIAFRPTVAEKRRFTFFIGPLGLLVLGAFVVLGLLTLFMFTAQPISLQFEPPADDVTLDGVLPTFQLGGRFLAQPGSYTVVAEKAGYHRFEQRIDVTDDPDQEYAFLLAKLPGYLTLDSTPPGATVTLDGEPVGTTPLTDLELEPGTYSLAVAAPDHLPHEAEMTIEGGATKQRLTLELIPNRAPVAVSSNPVGATVLVDGEELGVTPLTVEVAAGLREMQLSLTGFKTWQSEINVVPGEALVLPEVDLQVADGTVAIRTTPAGANVTIDGAYRGRTPLNVELAPGRSYRIAATKTGYETATRVVNVQTRGDLTVTMPLKALVGEVRIKTDPADAEIYVDGKLQRDEDRTLNLSALPHKIEIRKTGYVPYSTAVTPRPGFAQEIAVTLKTLEQARLEAIPQIIRSPDGGELALIRPSGRFTMGASRREQGRRANESLRQVELTRAYYLGLREVTNGQFRQFDPSHSSGVVQRFDLNPDDHPAVRVTWEEAARFCNWLSAKEGLPPVYEIDGEKVSVASPLTTGYRLPTEAEWVYAARIANQAAPLLYPWGNEMPPPSQAGNYADRAATRLVDGTMTKYRDGFAATAPVGSFEPNTLGIFDLGGNVAEWVNDFYAVYPDADEQLFVDPLGPDEGLFRVIRGSSWMHGTVTELRLSYRDYGDIDRPDVGFRIARYLE